nr:hypothetical protein CFP56_71207 [Quercus suber]
MDMLWYGVMEANWEQTKIEQIVMVAWAVWTNRNKLKVGGVKKSSQQVVYGALDFLAEFQEGGCTVFVLSTNNQTNWLPPPPTRWLPTPSTYKVISPPSLLGAEARVDQDTSSWNSELIRDVFLPHEAEDCAFVREVWEVSKLFPLNSRVHFYSFMDMLWYGVMEANWEQTKIEQIVMVAWAVWTNRNKLKVGGVKKSSQQVVYGALEFLAEFQEGGCTVFVLSTNNQTNWLPPPPTSKKLRFPLGAVEVEAKAIDSRLRFGG